MRQEGREHYYHMFANGDDAKNFIISEDEFKGSFNRFALCQHLTGVSVLSFSVEDTHPHALLFGIYEDCLRFTRLYETTSIKSITNHRGSSNGVVLRCELLEISEESHLMNVGAYTITQATKDGKAVMPYDYCYGTGALYFRSKTTILPWLIDENGHECLPSRIGDFSVKEQVKISRSRVILPGDYLVCNGFILPTNYVDIKRFEEIYRTHNCFRAFLASSKSRDEEILKKMAASRGVLIEDLQARQLCKESCYQLFGQHTTRFLTTNQRVELAVNLRRLYRVSFRQLALLVKPRFK